MKVAYIKKKKVFLVFLLSYIMVLIVPLTTGIIYYFKTASILEKNEVKYNNVMLEQVKKSIESQLIAIDQIATDVFLNSRIKKYLYHLKFNSNENSRYEVFELTKELARYSNINQFVNNMFLYSLDHDVILTRDAKYTPELFFSLVTPYTDIDYNNWMGIFKRYHYRRMMPSWTVRDATETYKMLIYMHSLDIDIDGKSDAILVFTIRDENITKIISDVGEINNSTLYIVDKDGRLLISMGDNKYVLSDIIGDLRGNDGTVNNKINGGNIVRISVQSNYNGWRYISIIPRDVFFTKVNYIRVFTLRIFFVSLILGLVIALFWANKHSLPIVKFFNNLRQKLGYAELQKGNEFDFLERILNDIYNKSKIYDNIIEKQVSVIKYFYPISTEERLIKAAKSGDYKETVKIIEMLFKQNDVSSDTASFDLVRCLFYDILCTAVKIINEVNPEYFNKNEFNISSYFACCSDISEMKQVVLDIHSDLCEYVKEVNKEQQSIKIINTICEYIRTNYSDTNLCLTTISNAVGLTPSYVSRLFQKCTGKSIVDFINIVRVNRAKELLESEKLLLEDIASKVGYVSAEALIRAFKKHEGITPGRYRELHCLK